VISGAAGAVGGVAGQIAKLKGCRTIGIAGGPLKCGVLVDEFGFDAAIDYKAENVRRSLREHAPGGAVGRHMRHTDHTWLTGHRDCRPA
jgi:NADPH-dependent curcumin reductase